MKIATINEAEKETNIPAFRIRKWVKMGIIPGFYAGSRFYVNVDEFVKLINSPEFMMTTKDLTAYIRGN